jgi:hypothetical protein
MDSKDSFHDACIDLGRLMKESAKNLSKAVIRSKDNDIEDSKELRMEKFKELLLEKYFKYRKENVVKDEAIDNILLKEMSWTNGFETTPTEYLFKDYDAVHKYFSVVDTRNHPGDNLPMKEHGYMCGDLWKGSSLCEGYNKAIFARIFEELERRAFNFGEKSC